MSQIRNSLISILKKIIFLEDPSKKPLLNVKICRTGKYMYVAPSSNSSAEIEFRCKNLTYLPLLDLYSEYKIRKGELTPLNPQAPSSQVAYIKTSLAVAIQAFQLLDLQKDVNFLKKQIFTLDNVLRTSIDGFSTLVYSEESVVLIRKINNSAFYSSFVQLKKIEESELENYLADRPISIGVIGYQYDTASNILKETTFPYSLILS